MDKINSFKASMIVAVAFVCGILLLETEGDHGIGWFVLCLMLIWGYDNES